ncbi:MAG: hypothetical protein HPY74_06395 [Firmicutes bacterium]|nr:hypothetical protein [Bacillota bacterium]
MIHPYEDKLQDQRVYQKTEEFKKDYSKRANGERSISHGNNHMVGESHGTEAKRKQNGRLLWHL